MGWKADLVRLIRADLCGSQWHSRESEAEGLSVNGDREQTALTRGQKEELLRRRQRQAEALQGDIGCCDVW